MPVSGKVMTINQCTFTAKTLLLLLMLLNVDRLGSGADSHSSGLLNSVSGGGGAHAGVARAFRRTVPDVSARKEGIR